MKLLDWPSDATIKTKWMWSLNVMLKHFRRNYPSDGRTDHELLTAMMEHFCACGIVRKDANGTYMIPDLLKAFDPTAND